MGSCDRAAVCGGPRVMPRVARRGTLSRTTPMSIVAAAGAHNELLPEAAVGAACLAPSLPVTYRLVRRGSFKGDDRLPPGGSAGRWSLALGCGLFVWTMVQAAFHVAWAGADRPRRRSRRSRARCRMSRRRCRRTIARLTWRTYLQAMWPSLSTVPHASAFVALLMADLLSSGGLKHLGFSLRRRRAVSGQGRGMRRLCR